MAPVTRIEARIDTADVSGAGTDGFVYVGLIGREFHLNTSADDFERASARTYVLGAGANVYYPAQNDPRRPQLDTNDLTEFPVYVRLERAGNHHEWALDRVVVTVNPGQPSEARFDFPAIAGAASVWLGNRFGKIVYLKQVTSGPPSPG
ncbi:hypothetical protein ACH4U6_36700 [Streptomyces netropsis]|uniref:hypothetical protein n=1 Tax=Streptomyces netropsis TaxID=55404 RepID=UPI0037875FB4